MSHWLCLPNPIAEDTHMNFHKLGRNCCHIIISVIGMKSRVSDSQKQWCYCSYTVSLEIPNSSPIHSAWLNLHGICIVILWYWCSSKMKSLFWPPSWFSILILDSGVTSCTFILEYWQVFWRGCCNFHKNSYPDLDLFIYFFLFVILKLIFVLMHWMGKHPRSSFP